MKNFLLLVVFFMVLQGGFAQSQQPPAVVDSLNKLLVTANSDTATINVLNELARIYLKIDLDSSQYYSNMALHKNNNSYAKGMIMSYGILGGIRYYNYDFDSAVVFFKKAYDVALQIDSKNDIAHTAVNIGVMYKRQGEYIKSIEYYQKALEIFEEIGNKKGLARTHYNIANLYYVLSKFNYGLLHAKKALAIADVFYPALKPDILNTIGTIYNDLGDYANSIKYLNEALKINIENNNKNGIARNLQNIANTYVDWGKYDLAMLNYTKVLSIKKEIGDEFNTAKTEYSIGKLAYKMGDYNKSIQYINSAKGQFDSVGNLSEREIIYLQLSKSYKGLNKIHKAYSTLEKAYQLNDSSNIVEIDKVTEELEIKYQSQQKENQILKLSNENIQKEAQLTQAKFTSYGIFGVLMLILGLGYILWFRQKQKQKLALLKSTVTASEAEKNRLGRELHDGIAGRILKIVYDTENNQTELSSTLLEIYNQVRHLSHQLDGTPVHGELFFDRLLEVIPEDNEKQTFNLTLLPNNMILQEPVGSSVYRIIQELITNNLKHAKADKTDIKIEVNDNRLVINYSDNGIGTNNFNKGNGFHSIEDRVTLLKGSVKINTHSAEGFQVEIIIPYTFDAK